jgi:hypothetical protein
MGVHQSSGQFTWHLRAQMNQSRHLSLPHTCARSLLVPLSLSPSRPRHVLTSLQGHLRTWIDAVEDLWHPAAGTAIEVPARITPSRIPSAGIAGTSPAPRPSPGIRLTVRSFRVLRSVLRRTAERSPVSGVPRSGRIRVASADCSVLARRAADSAPVDARSLVHRCMPVGWTQVIAVARVVSPG